MPEALERELARLARDVELPPTPSIAPAVVARLETDRAARARPPFPRIAIWSRRRALVAAAAALLLVLALAFGARYVIGAAEVRVQPGGPPSGPPLAPATALGKPVTLEAARAAVGFEIRLPAGPPPDEVYVFRAPGRRAGVLLAWDADERWPALPDTPWGLVLLQTPDDAETIAKDVDRFEDLHDVTVGGVPGFWIDAPHGLVVTTAAGTETFSVEGNVLIWSEGGTTFRLETALGRPGALEIARSIG
jgi:hypothetical protein